MAHALGGGNARVAITTRACFFNDAPLPYTPDAQPSCAHPHLSLRVRADQRQQFIRIRR